MLNSRKFARTGALVAFSVLFVVGVADRSEATGNIVKSDLKGTWRITLRGRTSCGFASMLATVTLGVNGSGQATLQIHSDGPCGDQTLPTETFTVNTLTTKGAGTATLTCGSGCGAWTFDIQVAPDRSKFNLTIVATAGAFLEGLAILGSQADTIVLADLQGEWGVTAFGEVFGLCGDVPHVFHMSAAGTLVLNTSGNGTMSASYHTTCGDGVEPSTITILSLNADGSGTAMMGCPEDQCQTEVSIQVSSDRTTFSFVAVAPSAIGDFLAGVATRRSTAGHIVKANLAGPWRAALGGEDSGGADNVSALLTFTLNAKGISNNLTIVIHDSDEGDQTITGTLTIQTLDPNGSGTALITVPAGQRLLNMQVSPDRSTFSFADVSTPDEFFSGTAVHQ